MATDPKSKHRHLPRLSAETYRGLVFVHWTMTIQDREAGWLDHSWFECVHEETMRLSVRYKVAIPAMIALPDHLHFLVAGTSTTSNQLLFVRALRRILNGSFPDPIQLQKQAFDHVLRPSERGPQAFAALVHYITQNPVRQGLVEDAGDWPYVAAVVPGFDDLSPTQMDFSTRWWSWWNQEVAATLRDD